MTPEQIAFEVECARKRHPALITDEQRALLAEHDRAERERTLRETVTALWEAEIEYRRECERDAARWRAVRELLGVESPENGP